MSTALYRRYRPDTFEDVIGQDHVTTPLKTALSKNRVNHAYLFSGPRGCGKTTSARILARCLNCVQGPTANPCGECPSCLDLATGGAGSLDVIEIDAASHGGVEDARDLRERATFAPARDRYKIFIIDEAHMVTSAGFNALLKIVEEPPEHIKFIFATTEPDKVIGTIRSRTHHYPFRLIPPEPMTDYVQHLTEAEQVRIAPGVVPLIVRAGGGSARDTLSVLDQLMAGSDEEGISYDLAVALLGFTHAELLDDVVDALAAHDSASVFSAVDRVIQSGQDPRRFVEDLLERFRDLILVRAVPENAADVLHGVPEDQIHRMATQAAGLGPAELSRWGDVTNAALTDMTGATSPRLHLELLCARLLLPSTDETERGLSARMDRVERHLSFGGAPMEAGSSTPATHTSAEGQVGGTDNTTMPEPDTAAAPGHARGAAAARAALRSSRPDAQAEETTASQGPATPQGTVGPAAAAARNQPTTPAPEPPQEEPQVPGTPESAAPSEPEPPVSQAEVPAQSGQSQDSGEQSASGSSGSAGSVEMFRRAWPQIMDHLKESRRFVWSIVQPHVTVAGFDGQALTLAFSDPGPLNAFRHRADAADLLRASINAVLGVTPEIDVAPGGEGGPKAEGRTSAPAQPRQQETTTPDQPEPGNLAPEERDVEQLAPAQPGPSQPAQDQQPPAAPRPDQGSPAAPVPDQQTPAAPVPKASSPAVPVPPGPRPTDSAPATPARPAEDANPQPAQQSQKPSGRPSRYQQLLAQQNQTTGHEASGWGAPSAPTRPDPAPRPEEEFVPSEDDEHVETSTTFGRAAFERLLNAKLIDETDLEGNPLPHRR